jgi:ribosomal protein L34E
MWRENMFAKKRRDIHRCFSCGKLLEHWPRGGAIVENCNSTQAVELCTRCLHDVLNLRGVKVISDNINRG